MLRMHGGSKEMDEGHQQQRKSNSITSLNHETDRQTDKTRTCRNGAKFPEERGINDKTYLQPPSYYTFWSLESVTHLYQLRKDVIPTPKGKRNVDTRIMKKQNKHYAMHTSAKDPNNPVSRFSSFIIPTASLHRTELWFILSAVLSTCRLLSTAVHNQTTAFSNLLSAKFETSFFLSTRWSEQPQNPIWARRPRTRITMLPPTETTKSGRAVSLGELTYSWNEKISLCFYVLYACDLGWLW